LVTTLCETVDPAGTSSAKSMTCVPDGTVDLVFAFFCLRLSLVLFLSPIARFEGLAPRIAKKEVKRKKKNACHKQESYGVRVSRPESLASRHQSGYLIIANRSTFQSPLQ
jgi:hypothetical protein